MRLGPTATRLYLHMVQAQEQGETAPSLAELAAACGLAKSTVYRHVVNLRRLGLLPPAAHGANGVYRPTLRVVAHTPQEHHAR